MNHTFIWIGSRLVNGYEYIYNPMGLKLTRKPAGAGIYVFTHPLRRLSTDAAEERRMRDGQQAGASGRIGGGHGMDIFDTEYV